MTHTETQELEIFVAVVRYGSFSKAADRLGIAASVVSRSIRRLEDKLKVTLFIRTTRKINVTEEGEWLHEQALDILDRLAGVEAHFKETHEQPGGTLKVDAATPFTLHAVAPLIPGYRTKYKHVSVVLSSSESIVDLIERNVDVAIRIGELSDSSLKARKLGNTYRKLYASPAYLQQHGPITRPDELSKRACLGFSKPDQLNTWPLRAEDGKWIKIKPEIIADSGETLKQLAIEGCGIACISSFIAEQEVRAGRLAYVLEQDTHLVPVPIYAVYYSDNDMNLRLRSFLDYLAEHIHLG